MATLFDGERMSLADAVDQTAASLAMYGQHYDHWALAFSGGKDSSATLATVAYLIDTGKIPAPKTKTLLYADTRLELPNLQSAALAMIEAAKVRGWDTQIVYPRLDKRFFVMILGRGVPPSHSGFRWCTGALKIEPMGDAMKSIRERTGEKLLLITGMRIGESANRDRRIALSCSKNGGECGAGWYEETTSAEVADVLSPLLHWRTCHVWDWLTLHGSRHGFDCRQVADVYDAGEEGSELEVLARTGCLVCPVASKDHALERTLRKPEWSYLRPLTELRELYDWLSQPHNRLQKVGERTASGALSSRPMRNGPLVISARKAGLSRVLGIQEQIARDASLHARPPVVLISTEEEARIAELIAEEAWPQGWDGTEIVGGEACEEVFRDGTVQPYLWAATRDVP